ncbi:MAG: Y-family DNA polymerase [Gammaproteobacteria bacterium]|nr:Y-family DNA polymerase [Gammaproteobacteria bacterium]
MNKIALVDCNNFYCSVERVFNPKLEHKPVVVLSNNDGCIISRSNEAKALGIKMAEPVYKIMPYLKKNKVSIYSSNYQLYGDMSHRVMTNLNYFVPHIDIYSIDECFINLNGFEHMGLINYSQTIKQKIYQWTGIPVAIGVGNNKVMAKLANHIAKKHKGDGVFQLNSLEQEQKLMKQLELTEIWGIGRRSEKKLKQLGLESVWDFYTSSQMQIKQVMGINGVQLYYALHNQFNNHQELEQSDKKSIASSRSFSTLVSELGPLQQALSNYIMIASKKLRKQGSYTSAMQIYLSTNPFQQNTRQYHNCINIDFAMPCNDSFKLIRIGKSALKKIYKRDYQYHKVGVLLYDLSDNKQIDLFSIDYLPGKEKIRKEKLMRVIDKINQNMGTDTVFSGAQGIKKHWLEKRNYLSQRYTTNWNELLQVN